MGDPPDTSKFRNRVSNPETLSKSLSPILLREQVCKHLRSGFRALI